MPHVHPSQHIRTKLREQSAQKLMEIQLYLEKVRQLNNFSINISDKCKKIGEIWSKNFKERFDCTDGTRFYTVMPRLAPELGEVSFQVIWVLSPKNDGDVSLFLATHLYRVEGEKLTPHPVKRLIEETLAERGFTCIIKNNIASSSMVTPHGFRSNWSIQFQDQEVDMIKYELVMYCDGMIEDTTYREIRESLVLHGRSVVL